MVLPERVKRIVTLSYGWLLHECEQQLEVLKDQECPGRFPDINVDVRNDDHRGNSDRSSRGTKRRAENNSDAIVSDHDRDSDEQDDQGSRGKRVKTSHLPHSQQPWYIIEEEEQDEDPDAVGDAATTSDEPAATEQDRATHFNPPQNQAWKSKLVNGVFKVPGTDRELIRAPKIVASSAPAPQFPGTEVLPPSAIQKSMARKRGRDEEDNITDVDASNEERTFTPRPTKSRKRMPRDTHSYLHNAHPQQRRDFAAPAAPIYENAELIARHIGSLVDYHAPRQAQPASAQVLQANATLIDEEEKEEL